MDKINTYVQFYLDEVELNVSVTKKLKGNLANFGYIRISSGMVDEKEIFWDGMEFLLSCSFEEFKEECGEDLLEAGFKVKSTFKSMKKLLMRAVKLKLLV